MLDKNTIIEKMKKRGFIVYTHVGCSNIHFVSERMYDSNYKKNIPDRQQIPVISIIVDLEKDTFHCVYQINHSLSQLITPKCGSILDDDHFNKIVSKFEIESKWMSRL